MIGRAPAFQEYASDVLALRLGLSVAADGATSRLERIMWSQSEDQCSLVDDDKFLAGILGLRVEEWISLREEIFHGRKLLIQKDGRIFSSRLKDEAAKQRKYRKLQKEKSKLGVEERVKRRLTRGSTRGSTGGLPVGEPVGQSTGEARVTLPTPFPSPIPTPSPIPIPKYKQEGRGREAPPRDVLEKQFEVEFWTPYPTRDGKKIGKQQAFEKYKELSADDRALIATAVQHLSSYPASADGIGVKDAHRWIKNSEGIEPWREWIEETQQTQKKNGAINVRDNKDYVTGTW